MSFLFARAAKFARSPAGRRLMRQAQRYAQSPEGRAKIQKAVDTAKGRAAQRRRRKP